MSRAQAETELPPATVSDEAVERADDDAAAPSSASRDAPSRSMIIAMLLLIALVFPWITSFAEWHDYRQSEFLLGRRAWSWSELPLVWVFFAKTQLAVLPGLLVALLLAARRWVNLAQVVLLGWLALIITWVVVEKNTYARTNVHVLDYLRFVGDTYAAQWAGNLKTMTYAILASMLQLARSFLFAAVSILAIVRIIGWSTRRWPRGRRLFAGICAGLYVTAIVAVIPAQHLYKDRLSLLRTHALLPFNFTWSAVGLELVDTRTFVKPLNHLLEPTIRHALPTLNAGAPPDTDAIITTGSRPNVLILGIESLRADALSPDIMPRLHALSSTGMQLRHHRSGARMTHLGLYSLLFARSPTFYWPTTVAYVPPQASVTFRKSGYRVNYVGSAHHEHWLNMANYLNDKFFDELTMYIDPDWPAMDVRTLARTAEVLRTRPDGKPQFVLAFLTSTHFPYLYPPEFEKRTPVLGRDWHVLPFDPQRDLPAGINRYRNSCEYVDHIVCDFLDQIDLTKTIVVITGDHGESLHDDGTMAHGGRWSDSQMRVPCLILGGGITPQVVELPSNHMDILPTVLHLAAGQEIPLRNTTGVDLLNGKPRPACEALSSESHDSYYEMLLMMNGRRLLVEFYPNRYDVVVRGAVEPNGNIDAFNLPPRADAQMWAEGIKYHLNRLTEIQATPASK